MSLSSALTAGVSGLIAQGSKIASISDNISNLNTTGYKATDVAFSTLVGNGLTAGGVNTTSKRYINGQGLIQNTGNSTDIAINGRGFMVVNSKNDGTGDFFYTRSGSFDVDSSGFLKNDAGFFIHGWRLDSEGRLPGETGNLNTTANSLLESTEAINITSIGGVATATTRVDLGINLNASQDVIKGAGPKEGASPGEIPIGDALNADRASDQIIIPTGFAGILVGDLVNITTGSGLTYSYTYGGFDQSNDISPGPILGATTPTAIFTGATNGDNFTMQTAVGGSLRTFTFTFQTSAPNPDLGTFNSMQTLADAINAQVGLTARTDNTDFMYFSAEDATQAVTVTDVTGTIAASLGLNSIAAGLNRFNSFNSLASVVNASSGISSLVLNGANDAQIELTVDSPLETIQITSTGNRFNTEFGIPNTVFSPIYNAAGIGGANMTSGVIPPDFIRNVRIFDSLGTGHDFRIGFLKSSANEWLVEVWAAKDDEIVTTTGPTKNQVASGSITFNGDGSLRSISASLTTPIAINWINESAPSSVTFDFGTAGPIAGTVGATAFGQTDGLSQFDGSYNVRFVDANGAETGNLRSIDFTEEGFLVANFSNGQSIRVAKIPLADFTNINGLQPLGGNVFAQSDKSGEFNLKQAGEGGTGKISPASLEATNVELADQLTRMIVAQRAYQANTKVITTTDDLLEELNRI